jgi:cell division protein FtsZ
MEAAQQAIESPLLEVSIDGARGILFNVIGGMDMTMHEINTAAEAITSAADPDANIIFGATINPDLEGELIITVVATGFDAAYFANRVRPSTTFSPPESNESLDTSAETKDDTPIADIDMDLSEPPKQEEAVEAFSADDDNATGIWGMSNDDSDDGDNSEESEDEEKTEQESSKTEEDELEKPSFLRRLKRGKQSKDDDKKES